MENFLRSKELWGLVETDYEEPASGSVQTCTKMKEARRIEAKRLESEKLSLSCHRSDDIGDHSCKENFQTNLGLYEEEV